jgi:hypothetical protein
MRVRLGAAAAGVVLIAAGVLTFSLASHPVVAGSNGIQPLEETVFLKGGVRYCQQAPDLPSEVTRLRLRVFRAGGGARALDVVVIDNHGRVARGTVPEASKGYVTARLDRPTPEGGIHHAGICFDNPGTGEIVLGGETKRCREDELGAISAPCATTPGLHPLDQKFRWLVGVRYLRNGSTNWLSEANVILDRFGFAQAGWFGTWALWLAGAFATLAVALALWWLAREPRAKA